MTLKDVKDGLKSGKINDGYLKNTYGLEPVIDYDSTLKIVKLAMEERSNTVQNTDMEMEKLRTMILSEYLID